MIFSRLKCVCTPTRGVSFEENATAIINNRLDYSIEAQQVFDRCRAKVCGQGLPAALKLEPPRLIIEQETTAKALPVDVAKLGEFSKCTVSKGTEIRLVPNVKVETQDGHLKVSPLSVPGAGGETCFLGGAARPVYFAADAVSLR